MKKTFLIIGIVCFIFLGLWLAVSNKKEDVPARTVSFEIASGENIGVIASNLKKEGIIGSKIYFIGYVYKNNFKGNLKAGKYILSTNLSVAEVALILTNGGGEDRERKAVKVTFPEGFNLKQMSQRLGENGFDGEEFLKLTEDVDYFKNNYELEFFKEIPTKGNLEGYLFPDTYFFFIDEKMESIIGKMLDNFKSKISLEIESEIKRQNKTIYEVLTMASLIEKEVVLPEDKKIVSGIFYNRLNSGQAFQSCATLAFILGENKKQYSYLDTQISSPYNTYLNVGLPPGPIASPGLESILAAVYPTQTNYNYFLSNLETGKTVFSTTLEEHNINKVKNGL